MSTPNDSSKLKTALPVVKSGSKIQIGITSLCNYDDDDDDEEEELALSNVNLKNKNPAPATLAGGEKPRSGLLSMLPPPKSNPFIKSVIPNNTASVKTNNVTSSQKSTYAATSTSSFLIPRTLKTAEAGPDNSSFLAKKLKLNPEYEEETNNSFTKSAQFTPATTTGMSYQNNSQFVAKYDENEDEPLEHDPDDDPEPSFDQRSNLSSQKAVNYPAVAPLDQASIHQIINGGRRKHNEHIEIVDISARDIVGNIQANQLKQITSEYRPLSNRDYFSSGSKRKHQITYLAHVAKEREAELQQTRSDAKFNKKQSRAKYGF